MRWSAKLSEAHESNSAPSHMNSYSVTHPPTHTLSLSSAIHAHTHPRTFAGRCDGDVAGLAAHIVDDGPLNHGNDEMCAFRADNLRHTAELIKDNGTVPTINCAQVMGDMQTCGGAGENVRRRQG